MKKILLFLVLMILLPFNVKALSKDYVDLIKDDLDYEVNTEKINIYLFHSDTCPHCKEEIEALKVIEYKYKDYIDIHYFEINGSVANRDLMNKEKEKFSIEQGVPFTIIGDNFYVGYSSTILERMENNIVEYAELGEVDKNIFNLPLIGKVSAKEFSLPLIAMALGFVDGFNPCAMWVLLFLINMLMGLHDKKRMYLIGFTFLLVSGIVYFLAILGINSVLSLITATVIRSLIGIVAIIVGSLNLKTYIKTRKDNGCHVIDEKKRKKIFTQINKFIHEKKLLLALIGVAALAIGVNFIELACSLGFPAVFSEILAINTITGIPRILYILLYTLFYMIDDIAVFIIAMVTLSLTGISTKYNKLLNLIGGIIMILMGILLVIKPEWIMFNF